MQRFTVQGMTCGHCVRSVTKAIQQDDPGADVLVDLARGEVQVKSSLGSEKILSLITEEGYAAQMA